MPKPGLYQEYDREDAIAFFGESSRSQAYCNGQWVILREAVICFAELGEPPLKSQFLRGSTFQWAPGARYEVIPTRAGYQNDRLLHEIVPSEHKHLPIQLFVRAAGGQRYLYVGHLRPSCVQQFKQVEGRHLLEWARFEMLVTLPCDLWQALGGYDPGLTDASEVDRALATLPEINTPEQRFAVLRELVHYWHGPIAEGDGIPADELRSIRLPDPLRWWYRWAGRRKNIMSGQSFLLAPDELKTVDGLLQFYVENQWVYCWATAHEGADPPVYGRFNESDKTWEEEGIVLTEHLILACLFEAITCHARYGASAAWLAKEKLRVIVDSVPPIPIGTWHWFDAQFYAKNGVFMYSMSNGKSDEQEGCSVWIGAKTEKQLAFLKPLIDEKWEYVAL